MNREEAKEMFRKDKDAYGKPRSVMKKIDAIYDSFEKHNNMAHIQLGYYAKDKNNNLFQFRWLPDNTFEVSMNNQWVKANAKDYQILEISAETADVIKSVTVNSVTQPT